MIANVLIELPEFFAVVSLVLGLLVGSFLNVVIYRVPREGPGVADGRSKCPSCSAAIRSVDNVPVLSWLLLRGRCRSCGVGISFRYPLVETITGIAFLGLFQLTLASDLDGFELWATLVVRWVVFAALFAASVIDLDFRILPDVITKPGMLIGVLASIALPSLHAGTWVEDWSSRPFSWENGLVGSLVGLAAGYGVMYAIRAVASWIFGREAMGLGDVKLMGALGAFVGLEGVFFTMLIGAFAGSLMGLANVLRIFVYRAWRTSRRGARRPRFSWTIAWLVGRVIPFGPALALGGYLVLLWRSLFADFMFTTWPLWVRGQLG